MKTIINAFKHTKRILRHKYFVFKYCCKLGIPWQGITHDLSKFSPTEFIVNDESYASSLQDQCLIVAIASQDSYATINWVDGQGNPQTLTP